MPLCSSRSPQIGGGLCFRLLPEEECYKSHGPCFRIILPAFYQLLGRVPLHLAQHMGKPVGFEPTLIRLSRRSFDGAGYSPLPLPVGLRLALSGRVGRDCLPTYPFSTYVKCYRRRLRSRLLVASAPLPIFYSRSCPMSRAFFTGVCYFCCLPLPR